MTTHSMDQKSSWIERGVKAVQFLLKRRLSARPVSPVRSQDHSWLKTPRAESLIEIRNSWPRATRKCVPPSKTGACYRSVSTFRNAGVTRYRPRSQCRLRREGRRWPRSRRANP